MRYTGFSFVLFIDLNVLIGPMYLSAVVGRTKMCVSMLAGPTSRHSPLGSWSWGYSQSAWPATEPRHGRRTEPWRQTAPGGTVGREMKKQEECSRRKRGLEFVFIPEPSDGPHRVLQGKSGVQEECPSMCTSVPYCPGWTVARGLRRLLGSAQTCTNGINESANDSRINTCLCFCNLMKRLGDICLKTKLA